MTIGGALVAALLAVPGAALAQSKLTLVIGGEAYDGPPKFEVLFDGETIGEGAITAAIDTATVGRFADTMVKAPYIESFEFDIPDAQFNAGGEVRIRFLNEAYGGDGSGRDRNLYVASVAINGLEVPATAMTTLSAAGLEPNAILGDFLVIFDGTADGVAAAPDMGWPSAGDVEVAAVEPEPEPKPDPELAPVVEPPAAAPEVAVVEPEPVVLDPVVEPEPEVAAAPVPEPVVETPAPEPEPVEVAAVPEVVVPAVAEPEPAPAVAAVEPSPAVVYSVETAAVPAAPVETVPLTAPEPAPVPVEVAEKPVVEAAPEPAAIEVAAVEAPAAAGGCSLDNLYNVLGFNENSNDLTPRVTERLDQIIKDIGDNVCTLSLTGYSSTQGDFDTNALFAIERAQNVLRYLRDSDLDYTTANAVGAGETDQFGPAFSDNRRVVITVTP